MRRIDSKPKKKTVNKITKSLNYNQSKGEFKKEPKEIKDGAQQKGFKNPKKKRKKEKNREKKRKEEEQKKGGEKKKEEGKEEEAKEEAFVTFPKV